MNIASKLRKIKRQMIIGIAVFVVFILSFAGAVMYVAYNNDTDQGLTDGESIEVTGEYICLAEKGDGEQTLECALGLETDEGTKYGLEFLGSRGNFTGLDYKTGDRLQVSGTFLEEDDSGYDSVGYIEVESLRSVE